MQSTFSKAKLFERVADWTEVIIRKKSLWFFLRGPVYHVSTVWHVGEYLELSEDQTSERHQELLAEFERRKKVHENKMAH